jgi:hypothetical protein
MYVDIVVIGKVIGSFRDSLACTVFTRTSALPIVMSVIYIPSNKLRIVLRIDVYTSTYAYSQLLVNESLQYSPQYSCAGAVGHNGNVRISSTSQPQMCKLLLTSPVSTCFRALHYHII